MIVNSTYRSAVSVRQLALYSIVRPFVLVHDCTELVAESMAAGKAFIASARSSLGLGSASTFNVGTGSNQIPDMGSFESYKNGVTGWQKLPGGLIIQWGQLAIGNGTYYAAYPLAFPSACTAVSLTLYGDFDFGSAGIWKMTAEAPTTSMKVWVSGLTQVAACSWIAIGY